MSDQAVGNFITTVAKMFPAKHDNADAERDWLSVMVRELSRYKAEVLGMAANEILATRKFRSFPLPAEIHDACAVVLKRLEYNAKASKVREGFKPPDDLWSRERLAYAYDSCRSTELGRKAAREGWVSRMFHYCREHQRLPDFVAVERLRKEAKEHRALIEVCKRGKGGAFSGPLAAWGAAMQRKEGKLVAEVLADAQQ